MINNTNKALVKAIDLAKELGFHLKLVTSVTSFENYNSFFNIYESYDEYCRRVAVLTPYETLEEVYDFNPSEKLKEPILLDGSIWLEEYPLTTNPTTIKLENILVDKSQIKKLLQK